MSEPHKVGEWFLYAKVPVVFGPVYSQMPWTFTRAAVHTPRMISEAPWRPIVIQFIAELTFGGIVFPAVVEFSRHILHSQDYEDADTSRVLETVKDFRRGTSDRARFYRQWLFLPNASELASFAEAEANRLKQLIDRLQNIDGSQ